MRCSRKELHYSFIVHNMLVKRSASFFLGVLILDIDVFVVVKVHATGADVIVLDLLLKNNDQMTHQWK